MNAHGYQLTGCNGEAQALLDQALAQFRCLHAASLATTEAALRASPELVMGHVLHAWLYLLGTEAAAHSRWPGPRVTAPRPCRTTSGKRVTCTPRGCSWMAAGTPPAALEDLSVDYPHDLLGCGRPPDRLLHRRRPHAARPHRPRAARLVAGSAGLPRPARAVRVRPARKPATTALPSAWAVKRWHCSPTMHGPSTPLRMYWKCRGGARKASPGCAAIRPGSRTACSPCTTGGTGAAPSGNG